MSAQLLCLIRISLFTGLLVPLWAGALNVERKDVQQFITEMADSEQFDPDEIQAVLSRSTVQQSILDAMSRPAEKVKPWYEYRAIFITPERIKAGTVFYAEHRDTLLRIEKETGVPPEMILGIIGVESYFGRITGKHRVVDALVTLGFDYPPRANFFRGQLGQAFLLAREENLDVEALMGSYAGAIGPPQFIPSSYRNFAVDGNGDGQRDLMNSWEDILASVANYFAVHKWQAKKPVAARATITKKTDPLSFNDGLKPHSTVSKLSAAGVFFPFEQTNDATADIWLLEGETGPEYWVGFDNLYVITRYNHSIMYALAAWELGTAIILEADL
ncbi:MAG: lytic murein transglycosylase B [Gammaproteobacteria bacterium]|nr:lytic murein transglycosylase B [Gammaproteobacteria bacterium]